MRHKTHKFLEKTKMASFRTKNSKPNLKKRLQTAEQLHIDNGIKTNKLKSIEHEQTDVSNFIEEFLRNFEYASEYAE